MTSPKFRYPESLREQVARAGLYDADGKSGQLMDIIDPALRELVAALGELLDAAENFDMQIHNEWGVGKYEEHDDIPKARAVLEKWTSMDNLRKTGRDDS